MAWEKAPVSAVPLGRREASEGKFVSRQGLNRNSQPGLHATRNDPVPCDSRPYEAQLRPGHSRPVRTLALGALLGATMLSACQHAGEVDQSPCISLQPCATSGDGDVRAVQERVFGSDAGQKIALETKSREAEEKRLWNPTAGRGAVGPPVNFSLSEAVTQGALTFPEIRIQEQRLREARAGIDVSASQLYPSLEVRVGSGGSFTGNYSGGSVPYDVSKNQPDGRLDTSFALRQLLFDFGATAMDVSRADFIRQAEQAKLRDKIDDTSFRIAQLYLRLSEMRTVSTLLDETVAAHHRLLGIVKAQADEGHGTLADVNRVQSRLVDIATIRSDLLLQIKAAEDNFIRLTGFRPGRLRAFPSLRTKLPPDAAEAVARAKASNPRIESLVATQRSAEAELEFQKRSNLPRFGIEVDNDSKNLRDGKDGRSELNGRAMVAMRVRLLDGGLARATERQIEARIAGAGATLENESQLIATDLFQAYRTIETASQKQRLITDGVRAAGRVQELYLEQFKGGRRTVFELLDGQMAFYTARRSQIETSNEANRAMLDILRATGELTRAIMSTASASSRG